jgi:hypothetical protein
MRTIILSLFTFSMMTLAVSLASAQVTETTNPESVSAPESVSTSTPVLAPVPASASPPDPAPVPVPPASPTAETNANPTWQMPLKPEKAAEVQKEESPLTNFQIPSTEDNSKYPLSEVSFFYTPGSGAFIQKFANSDGQMTFNTSAGRSFRTLFEYKFNYHYSVGGFLSTYTFNTDEKQFTFITMKASSNPMLTLGAFLRWSAHLTSLQKKLSFDFAFTKESIPLIDSSPDNELLLEVYTYKPTFWNLAINYQTPLTTLFDILSFFQYGAPIDSPSQNGLKLSKAHHIVFGAALATSVLEKWKIQVGVENSSYLAEARYGNATNQSLMSSLIFKLGLTYELPQWLPDKPKTPANMDTNSEYLQGI